MTLMIPEPQAQPPHDPFAGVASASWTDLPEREVGDPVGIDQLTKVKRMRTFVIRLAPSQSMAPHRAPAPITLVVLDGHATILADGREIDAVAGTVVSVSADVPHGVRAGVRPATVLGVVGAVEPPPCSSLDPEPSPPGP